MASKPLGSSTTNLGHSIAASSKSKHLLDSPLFEQLDTQKRKIAENTDENTNSTTNNESTGKINYKLEIVWRNVIIFVILHSIVLNALYIIATNRYQLLTPLFALLFGICTTLGVTGGAHRLWTHRTYKANLPLRILLMVLQTSALQNDIFEWSRDHRVHHKYTDTDADPHNASRGFFFAHMGWLMVKKHKSVIEKGKSIDLSDLLADPVVRFQKKFYVPLIILLTFVVPTAIPCYFWGEDPWTSFSFCVFRYVSSLHLTWLINSAAHFYGDRPYDKSIRATDGRVLSTLTLLGEAWHNYHHVFPWDYKAAELGNYSRNLTTGMVDFFAKIGWATELKTASEEIVIKRLLRTGDGSWPGLYKLQNDKKYDDGHHQDDGEMIWGWGDKDMSQDEAKEIRISNRIKS